MAYVRWLGDTWWEAIQEIVDLLMAHLGQKVGHTEYAGILIQDRVKEGVDADGGCARCAARWTVPHRKSGDPSEDHGKTFAGGEATRVHRGAQEQGIPQQHLDIGRKLLHEDHRGSRPPSPGCAQCSRSRRPSLPISDDLTHTIWVQAAF